MAKRKLPPNVERTSRGKFRARVTIQGKLHTGTSRETPEEAYSDVETLKAQVATNTKAADGPTLGEALELVRAMLKRRGTMTPRTMEKKFEPKVRSLLKYYEADTPVALFTKDEVLGYVNEALEVGRPSPRKPKTVGEDLLLLDQVFEVCGVGSPIAAVRRELGGRLSKDDHVPKCFTKAQAVELLRRVREEPVSRPLPRREHDYALFVLGLCTGIRAGEIARMKVEHVRLEAGEVFADSKKSESRWLPIPPIALDALRTLLEGVEDRTPRPKNRICHRPSEPGHYLIPGDTYDAREQYLSGRCKAWGKLLGLGPFGGFRAFRQTTGNEAIEDGLLSITDVQGLYGHRNVKTTSAYYHRTNSRSKRTREGVTRWADGLLPPTSPTVPSSGTP